MTNLRTRFRALAVPAALLSLAAAAAPALSAEQPSPRWRAPDVLAAGVFRVDGLAGAGGASGDVVIWNGDRAGATVFAAELRSGASAWSAPRALATNCSASEAPPVVAANAAGDVVAAWVCSDFGAGGPTTRVQAARRVAGGAWEPTMTVLANATEQPRLDVAVAADGEATLLWALPRDGVHVAVLPAGGTWGAPRTLDSVPGDPGVDVDLALRPDGSGSAAWLRDAPAGRAIVLATRARSGAWSAPEIASTGTNAYYPAVAPAADGELVVAWTDGARGPRVVVRVRGAGGAWSAPEPMGKGYAPRLDAVPGGRVLLTWNGGEYLQQTVRIASRRPGAAWKNVGTLPNQIGTRPRTWGVATAADGGAWIATVDRAPAVRVARLDADSDVLDPSISLSNPSAVRPEQAAIAAGRGGEAVAAWSGLVQRGALGLARGGAAVQAAEFSRSSARPPLVTRPLIAPVNAGNVQVVERALLRLTPTFTRYAGPVPVVVQRLVAGRWRAVARAVARAETPMAVRLTGPGRARLRLAYRSGSRTLFAPVKGVTVTRPANPRIPAGAFPGDAVVAEKVLWTIGADVSGGSAVHAFDAGSGKALIPPFVVPASRLMSVGDRVWLTSLASPKAIPLDVTARGGRGPAITLPGAPISVVGRGKVAWMIFNCAPTVACNGLQLQRIDPDTGATIGAASTVHSGLMALGPDALWTARPLPCEGEDCEEAIAFEVERRDRMTGEVAESGGSLGVLSADDGQSEGGLVATAGAVWARDVFGRIVRRGLDGTLTTVDTSQRYGDLAADGSGVLALEREDGAVATIDAAGHLLGRKAVGLKSLADSQMAVAPRAVWVTAPIEGTLIRVGR
ncbi:MAG: hypothetical protein QOD86_2696 [Miltoncostaeaceae bacterium]|jgi:hypothetical protein|nr:hypothetical protein [Miltoncostaeaceae bacterium]